MPKVLIVDDVEDNVELLVYALEDQGYEVVKAFNGFEALELTEATMPDVIMLDIVMPGIDGIEVCRRLKANPKLDSIPVIMVSALDEDSILMQALEAGAQDYIIKPYNMVVATARLQIVMARIRSAAAWKLTEESLKDRDQRFQAVFNQTFQFMGLLDPAGLVLEVNRVALEWIKDGREGVVGHPLWDGPWWKDSPRAREQLRASVVAATRGRVVSFEAEHPGFESEAVYLEFSVMPVCDKEGRVTLLLVVGNDITDRKRAQAAMCAAKESAEANNQSKSEFMANVSHEIRTPMNAILGMTELTLDSELNPEQRDNLEIVRSATDSLLSVINDLLDFSKMEAGKLELDPVPFRLRGLIGDIMALLGRRAQVKGLELDYCVDPDVPDGLVGDPVRLRQILVNLIGNAIKFTERGKVAVGVTLEAETGGTGEIGLHFRVIDTGIGIPPDKCESVFDPFTQADGSTRRHYGGTGLGLTISSQLVDLMRGRVWVESEVGRGSTFHLIVHVTPEEETPSIDARPIPGLIPSIEVRPSPPVIPAPQPGARPLRILLAEDNPFNQKVALLMLGEFGHSVTIADDGRKALAALEHRSFDLVLMDIQMPEMDGFEATVAIRAAERGTDRHIAIIALTAHAMKEDREHCLSSGMDEYVSKPIQKDKLRQAIEGCISRGLITAGAAPSDENPGSPMDEAAPLARSTPGTDQTPRHRTMPPISNDHKIPSWSL